MEQVLKDVQTILGGLNVGSHIGITELQRKTSWREEFTKSKIMEVLDRNETFAVMLTPEVFRSVQAYIEQLEQQVEQLQLDALFARREGNMNWMTGEDLKQKAKASFHTRKDLIRGLLDGDK